MIISIFFLKSVRLHFFIEWVYGSFQEKFRVVLSEDVRLSFHCFLNKEVKGETVCGFGARRAVGVLSLSDVAHSCLDHKS